VEFNSLDLLEGILKGPVISKDDTKDLEDYIRNFERSLKGSAMNFYSAVSSMSGFDGKGSDFKKKVFRDIQSCPEKFDVSMFPLNL